MNKLRDPFNPNSGEFARNIRSLADDDLTELCQSMKEFGWRKEFPAYADERGVLLVGHRRMAIAHELAIEPVIVRLTLGNGEQADAERLKIAIASNVGFKEMTAADRKRIATYLYGDREWTMQRIAEALGVGETTIKRDLANLSAVDKLKHTKTVSNPKGAGRPKGSKAASGKIGKTDLARELVRPLVEAGKGVNREKIARQLGISDKPVQIAIALERERLLEAKAEPQVDPKSLAMSAQEKLAAAIRQHKRALDLQFEMRVLAECKARMDAISLPHYAKQLAELERSIRSRKGIMDRITYRKILACLHPDRVTDLILKKRYEEAFRLFTELEKRVLDEKESPTQFRTMPRTYEELMAMKAKVQAERRARRNASSAAVR